MSENISIGKRVGSYLLTERVGRGAHGVVYKGHHTQQPDEIVAIKVVENQGQLDSHLLEAEILSHLQHPHIVSLVDYFLHKNQIVLVMGYIDGVDLQTYIDAQGPLSAVEVKNFLMQMAEALSHAHAQDVMHRDIKPSNILVTGSEQDKQYILVDFGISRMAEGIQTTQLSAGTYPYMAPEQLRGRPGKRSDLWALGVMAYVLLTGTNPFAGHNREEVFQKILYETPFLLDDLDEADADLNAVIRPFARETIC